MTSPRVIRNLALVGFMGSGKSTVGRLVARDLGLHFVDTDELIEQRAGSRISEIFATQGEAVFRALEREILGELVRGDDHVREIRVPRTGERMFLRLKRTVS